MSLPSVPVGSGIRQTALTSLVVAFDQILDLHGGLVVLGSDSGGAAIAHTITLGRADGRAELAVVHLAREEDGPGLSGGREKHQQMAPGTKGGSEVAQSNHGPRHACVSLFFWGENRRRLGAGRQHHPT